MRRTLQRATGFRGSAGSRKQSGALDLQPSDMGIAGQGDLLAHSIPGTIEDSMGHPERELSNSGMVCWLEERPDGQVRLVMDDVDRSSADPMSWKKKVLFTWRDYDASVFLQSELSEQELADIGLQVVTRLAALAQGASRGRAP